MPAKGNGNDQHKQIGAPPRVYALTQSDNGPGPSNMVPSQISITQTSTYVLMDTGASHSFVPASFVEKLNRNLEPMPVICGVFLPSREDMLVRTWVRVVPVWVENHELTVDLLVLDLHEYDVIFGMD